MPHGGRRNGAGRPKGTGKYGEKTVALRVPESLADYVRGLAENGSGRVPLYASRVRAGSPTFAEDDIEDWIDLGSHLVKDPKNTFCVRVTGDSMVNAGIEEGDILVVSRGQEPRNGKTIIARLDDEFTVKRYKKEEDRVLLFPENTNYQPIDVSTFADASILGTVMNVIKGYRLAA